MKNSFAIAILLLAAIGVANAGESNVTVWIGWSVSYSKPIFDEEIEHNIKHESWTAYLISNSQSQCEAGLQAYGSVNSDEGRICKPVGLSKDDFDHESHFALCSHLQSLDMAVHVGGDSYQPLETMCDMSGLDREWVSLGVEWYESHPLTQSCLTWMRRNGPTFSVVTGHQITRAGGAHASTAQSVSAVRAEVGRRASRVDLLPGQIKSMSAEAMQSWQNREAGKRIASAALRIMNDKMLESWVEHYCAENTGDTLRDAGLALFSELRQPK